MRRPFAYEPNSISSSARFSPSIRPLTVNVTSPFADLVILSILPLVDTSLFAVGGSHDSITASKSPTAKYSIEMV